MTDGVFLKEIEFKNDFPPFEKDTKVKFGDEMQEILEFYLRNKGLKEGLKKEEVKEIEVQAKSVAGRMKINVIVGENGTGKSRLFEEIIKGDAILCIKNKNDKKKLNEYLKEEEIEVILDDFFVLGGLFSKEENVNRYIFLDRNPYAGGKTDYVFNNILFSNYLINKKYEIDILKILRQKPISYKFSFGNYGEHDNLRRYFRKDFLYGGYEGSDKNEAKIEDINFKGKSQDIFHLSYSSRGKGKNCEKFYLCYYKDLVLKLYEKNNENSENNEINKINKIYKNLLNFILYKFISIYVGKKEQNFSGITLFSRHDELTRFLNELKEEIKKDGFIEGFLDYLYKLIDEEKIKFNDILEFIEVIHDRVFFVMDIKFNGQGDYTFQKLSAGEKVSFLRIGNIYLKIISEYNFGKKNFLILIDEPDLHLHLDWQRQYIQKLIDVFAEFLKDNEDISLHFIIATHSPFILSDVPAENVVLLQKGENGYTKVTGWKEKKGTFGANFVDLIRNGFFFDTKNLMGSFAEEVIDKIAQIEKDKIIKNEEVEDVSKIKNKIGDTFLRDNLLYFKKSDKDAKDGCG